MPNLLLSLYLPLRVRGIKGSYFHNHNSDNTIALLASLRIRGEFLEKLMRPGCSGSKTVWTLWPCHLALLRASGFICHLSFVIWYRGIFGIWCLRFRISQILVVRPFRVVRHGAKASHYIPRCERESFPLRFCVGDCFGLLRQPRNDTMNADYWLLITWPLSA